MPVRLVSMCVCPETLEGVTVCLRCSGAGAAAATVGRIDGAGTL